MTSALLRARDAAPLVAIAAALLLPATAQAVPGWLSAPFTVAPAGGDQLRDVAFTPGGEAIAVWTTNVGGNLTVRAGIRPPGGSFPAGNGAQALSGAVDDVPGVRVVALPDGGAVATWSEGTGAVNTVRASVRPPGGGFGGAVSLSGAGQIDAPDLDVAANGAVGVTWAESIGADDHVRLAVRPPGGSFPAPTGALSLAPASEGPSDAHIGVGPGGRAVVAWTDSSDPNGTVIRASDGVLGGAFSTARNMTPSPAEDTPREGIQALEPDVDVDAAGTATLAWQVQGETAALDGSAIESRSLDAAGAFTAPDLQRVSPVAEDADPPAVGVSDQGEAVVAWSNAGDPEVIRAAVGPAAGPLALTAPLSDPADDDTTPRVAFDPAGNAIVAWQAGVPGVAGFPSRVEAARRPAGGAFAGPAVVSTTPPTTTPAVALDSEGNGFVAWTQGAFAARRIDGAGYDNAPPRIRTVRSPAALRPSTSFAFSVTADDVWAASPSASWDFGDGTTGNGATVDHAYASPGTYQGRVSVTDDLGNAAMRAFTVVVDPDAPATVVPGLALTDVSADRNCIAAPGRRVKGAGRDLTIRYTLNFAARMSFTLQRRLKPKAPVLRRRCPAPTTAGSKPVRYDNVGVGEREVPAGVNFETVDATRPSGASASAARPVVLRLRGARGRGRLKLRRLLAGQALAPGRYRVLLAGTRADGSRSATVAVRFWVLAGLPRVVPNGHAAD
jgi:hypothetical protein